MSRRALVAIVAIAVLAAASGWLSRQTRQAEPQSAGIPAAPDYFANNFVALTTGADGSVLRQLQAREMVHLPESDQLELTEPHITLFEQSTPRWEITAQQGRVERSGEQVLLDGQVRLWQMQPRPLELRTQSLLVHPQRHFAQTDDPVEITAPEGRVSAVGMEADLQSRQISLLSKVQGIYEPTEP